MSQKIKEYFDYERSLLRTKIKELGVQKMLLQKLGIDDPHAVHVTLKHKGRSYAQIYINKPYPLMDLLKVLSIAKDRAVVKFSNRKDLVTGSPFLVRYHISSIGDTKEFYVTYTTKLMGLLVQVFVYCNPEAVEKCEKVKYFTFDKKSLDVPRTVLNLCKHVEFNKPFSSFYHYAELGDEASVQEMYEFVGYTLST